MLGMEKFGIKQKCRRLCAGALERNEKITLSRYPLGGYLVASWLPIGSR